MQIEVVPAPTIASTMKTRRRYMATKCNANHARTKRKLFAAIFHAFVAMNARGVSAT
jgi:hypothetical protein